MLKKLRNKFRNRLGSKGLDADTYRLLLMNKKLSIKRNR